MKSWQKIPRAGAINHASKKNILYQDQHGQNGTEKNEKSLNNYTTLYKTKDLQREPQ